MSDDWIVRVNDREYGPVDLTALREWQRQGRLIATNEIRHADLSRFRPQRDGRDNVGIQHHSESRDFRRDR